MSSARAALLESMFMPAHFDQDSGAVAAQQLLAAQELFALRRQQIPLLARRAQDAGIDAIRRFEDLVPLLFPHTAYKSYPQRYVDEGQWQRLSTWLDGLSVADVRAVDVCDVQSIDEWVERLWAAGHEVMATSGTSGKCSFLNRTLRDREMQRRNLAQVMGGFVGLAPNADRAVFQLFPSGGPNNGVQSARLNAELWARPGDAHFLGAPLKISEVSFAAAVRKRMADGTATPDDIAALQTRGERTAVEARAALKTMIGQILDRRHEPMFLAGPWAQHWSILQAARERGIADGDFHPQTLVAAGGGTKGIALPEDYEAQIARFYGAVKRPKNYGMTEMLLLFPRCEHQRYHQPAGVISLVLDDSGDAMQPRSGQVSGRFGFVDLSLDGRWGGVISGDRVTMDFSDRCPCGRSGPTMLEPITRHAPPGADDHIGCAGTIDAYLRGPEPG